MRYIAVIVMLLLLSFSSLAAQEIVEIDHEDLKASVEPGEVAKYSIKVRNLQKIDDTFYLSVDDIRFSPTLDPITDFTSGIKMEKSSIKETTLLLVPRDDMRIGEYQLRLDLLSKQTSQVYSEILRVYLAPAPSLILTPNVSVRLAVQEHLDPREPFTVTVSATNYNALDLGEVVVDVKSGLFHREQVIELGPQGSDSVSFQIALDPLESPRKDFVVATISKENTIYGLDKMDVEVVAFSPALERKEDQRSEFLKTWTKITLSNKGNVPSEEVLKLSMPWYRRLFSHSEPAGTLVIEEGKPLWTYEVSLGKQEKFEVLLSTSYRVPFGLFLVALVAALFYWILRTPVVVEKQAKVVEKTEGGVSKLKIYLRVKNRSTSAFENITIVDKVSSIVRVLREKQLGTLAPNRVVRRGQFLFVEWQIPRLEAGEERIIHYRIESRLSILGDFKLKRAMVEYMKDGVKSKSFSNEFFMETKETKETQ